MQRQKKYNKVAEGYPIRRPGKEARLRQDGTIIEGDY